MAEADQPDVKQCCAAFYGSDLARMLLGDSFHPGGTRLTDRLGRLTQLTGQSKVLDVAAGRGTSAFYLADCFGCQVVGVDLSEDNVREATADAIQRGAADRVQFKLADAERLPFEPHGFDALFCECAFCTFPDKSEAAREFHRVLKPGGRLGLSDLTRSADSIAELDGLLSWVACIGDAQSIGSYVEIFKSAGFRIDHTEDHSQALIEMVQAIQGKLLGIELMAGLKVLNLPGADLASAKKFAQAAKDAINAKRLGYWLLCGT